MIHLELLIYPLILLLITLPGATVSPKGTFSERALDREQAKRIQAFAAIAIVLHHLTQHITEFGNISMGPISVMNDMGFFFTSVFLFFSGYGLMVSLDTKEDYLKSFLGNRLPVILIPLWLSNLLGVIIRFLTLGSPGSTASVIKDLLGLTLINSNAWFIIEIAVLYLLFRVIFGCIRNRKAATVAMFVAVIALILLSASLGHDAEGSKSHWFRGEWWYNSLPSFLFGLVIGQIREKFFDLCRRRYRPLIITFALLTPAAYAVASVVNAELGYYVQPASMGRVCTAVTFVVQAIAELIFLTFLILIDLKMAFGNPVLKFLGRIQLFLFLTHKYFLDMIFGPMGLSPFVLYGVVLVSGIACAALLTPLSDFIISVLKKGVKKKKRLAMVFALITCASLILMIGRSQKRSREFHEEYRVLTTAQVGDLVYYGRYEMDSHQLGKERVSWLVFDRTEDTIWLLSEYGLGGSFYNRAHADVEFRDSDLREILNSRKYLSMFGKEETRMLASPDGDKITLLTQAQAESFFASDVDRQLAITDAAERSGTNINTLSKANNWDMKGYRSSWWWLRGEDGSPASTAPIVTVDGTIEPASKEVNRPGGAIRPVIRVSLQ